MRDLRTTNILLLIIVIPIVFYLLHILSFIFIPLVSSMFIALLFLPLMRWLSKKKVPKFLSILLVIFIIAGVFKIGGELIQLSSKEIMATDKEFFDKAKIKVGDLIVAIESFFGIDFMGGREVIASFFEKDKVVTNFQSVFGFIGNTISMVLITAFFVVLWLAESINFHKILNNLVLKQKYTSVKTFMRIEKDLIKFIKVKFIISLFTGIGTGLACHFFEVSFPIFWGLFAFIINFVQMVGSIITVILLSIFAFVEVEPMGIWLFFALSITGVQVLFGSILEPIFMGKSFSINIITILVMLMFWGFIWGIPGMIMAIPITVFLKIILEQFPNTKRISQLFSGSQELL